MNSKVSLNITNKFKVVLFIIIISMVLSSCNLNEQSSFIPTITPTTVPGEDLSQEIESGTLRLWSQPIDFLNPLISNSLHYEAISKLIFQGLFEINNDGTVSTSIAKEYSVSDNKRVYTVILRDDVVFHNNKFLSADDIIASFDYIVENKDVSYYYSMIKNIRSISKIDEHTINITLRKENPFTIFDLTFPILPLEELSDEENLNLPSGTGPFKIVDKNDSKLQLKISETYIENEILYIDKINVLLLENSLEAMEYFSSDKIDMVVLNDDLYSKYYLRNDLSITKYNSNTLMFFDYNFESENKFENQTYLLKTKTFLYNCLLADDLSEFLSPSIFPFAIDSGFISKNYLWSNPIDANTNSINNDALIIYNKEDFVSEKIARSILNEQENHNGFSFQLKDLPRDEYLEAIEKKEYDIAIRTAILNNNPDPSWIYLGDPFDRVKNSGELEIDGEESIDEYISVLKSLYKEDISILDDVLLYNTLDNINKYANYQMIGFKVNAVLQGKRTNGQLLSDSYNKFRIEGMWIWSGQ